MIPISEWRWFGDPGHFIMGRWCRFHLTTKVGEILVSTVGVLVHPKDSGGSAAIEREYLKKNPDGADIAGNFKYETMAFRIEGECNSVLCECGLPGIDPSEIEFRRYNTRTDATRGHREMCMKMAEMQ